MRVRLRNQADLYHLPKTSFVIGVTNSYELKSGIGIGFSYYNDGNLDFGFIIGKSYFNLELLWGRAEEFSYYEDEEEAEQELESWLVELAEQERQKD